MPEVSHNPIETSTAAPKSAWRNLFRSLSHRNFRLFVSGQLISLMGTWIQQVAMSWLIYKMTHSAYALGLMSFASNAPGLFIAPLAGGLSDRLDRRKVMLCTQTLA